MMEQPEGMIIAQALASGLLNDRHLDLFAEMLDAESDAVMQIDSPIADTQMGAILVQAVSRHLRRMAVSYHEMAGNVRAISTR